MKDSSTRHQYKFSGEKVDLIMDRKHSNLIAYCISCKRRVWIAHSVYKKGKKETKVYGYCPDDFTELCRVIINSPC